MPVDPPPELLLELDEPPPLEAPEALESPPPPHPGNVSALIGLFGAILVGGFVWGLTPSEWEAELQAEVERKAKTRDLREEYWQAD